MFMSNMRNIESFHRSFMELFENNCTLFSKEITEDLDKLHDRNGQHFCSVIQIF